MPKRGEKGGEIIHCTDGNKNEVHPAVDIGGREERDDGTYRRIRWVTNDEYTWVHESRVVTLSRKRQRSKTQRWSGDGATLPSTAKQARNDDDESSSAASNAGRRNRSKRTPKAPTRRSASVRRITGMKSKVTIPKPMCLSEISMHSDDDDDLSSIDDDDRKPAYRELTTTNSRRSTRSKRQKRPGNMASVSSTILIYAMVLCYSTNVKFNISSLSIPSPLIYAATTRKQSSRRSHKWSHKLSQKWKNWRKK
jgi:hypothetical protein